MRKLLLIPAIQALLILSMQAQPVSDYLYKLDNGITVKNDHTWSQVWVQQNYAPLTANDQSPLHVDVRTLGDLVSGSSYILTSNGKEVKMKGVAPGTYDLKMTFKLSGEAGNLSFSVPGMVIKPKMKTNVMVTLYDYQIMIDESASSSTTASFETAVQRCKLTPVQASLVGMPSFFSTGDHSKAITPDEGAGKTKGKIKPGTYDVLLTINLSGQNHKIWLNEFQMKPGTNYKMTTNLNAGGIVYTGGNKDVKSMHLYPAGTAAKQTGTPMPVKGQETISYANINELNCCTPGTFDVLLRFGNGDKYEWRKNVAVTTGTKTEVK
ncbi:MAG TPA: hypothetical protein VK207_01640 [Bacteroidales bacterium]|nr:hypothetical protein [Bacteroidales bacterium]